MFGLYEIGQGSSVEDDMSMHIKKPRYSITIEQSIPWPSTQPIGQQLDPRSFMGSIQPRYPSARLKPERI